MDSMLITVKQIKASLEIKDSKDSFLRSMSWLEFCQKKERILIITPNKLDSSLGSKYFSYLVDCTRNFLSKNPQVQTWDEFSRLAETRKTHKLLFEFGVRGALFSSGELDIEKQKARSSTSLTLPEFYEVCQIQFGYEGSFGSFTKIIENKYGSFAEYCVLKGFDINGTRWENQETAIRVARKLGSKAAVKAKATTLHKYLSDRNLLDAIFAENDSDPKSA